MRWSLPLLEPSSRHSNLLPDPWRHHPIPPARAIITVNDIRRWQEEDQHRSAADYEHLWKIARDFPLEVKGFLSAYPLPNVSNVSAEMPARDDQPFRTIFNNRDVADVGEEMPAVDHLPFSTNNNNKRRRIEAIRTSAPRDYLANVSMMQVNTRRRFEKHRDSSPFMVRGHGEEDDDDVLCVNVD